MNDSFPYIRLGLCCMNIQLKFYKGIYSSRRRTIKQIEKLGIESLKELSINNVIDLKKMLKWNKKHGIHVMRVNSEIFPHITNPKIIEIFGEIEGKGYSSMEFLRPYLEQVGEYAKSEDIRLTFHPGQYTQLASPSMSVFYSSSRDLEMHSKIFDMMKLSNESVIVIHIGGVYANKRDTIKRFKERFKTLPDHVKDRLVFENDEKCYDAEDVLEICQSLKVPMVFDIFHYECYRQLHPEVKQKSIDELMPSILKTWNDRGVRPKFHLSEQYTRKRIGTHSVFIDEIPKVLLDIPKKYGVDIDIMIEAKGKEIAIGKLYRKYPLLKSKFAKDIKLDIHEKALNF